MDVTEFWEIIDGSRPSAAAHPDECEQRLGELLRELDPDEIIEWNHIFDRLVGDLYSCDHLAACSIINTGAGDDGFYYYRCWLVGMGREVYEAALASPDSLADVADYRRYDAEAEIYAVAHEAWLDVTGEPDTAPYPARNEFQEWVGEDWDVGDDEEVARRFPKLTAIWE